MFLGSFDLARIVGSPLGMAAQVSPAAQAAQMSPANQVFGAVTGELDERLAPLVSSVITQPRLPRALSSLPDIDFNSPVQGVTQGSVGGGILENRLGLEFLKNIFDRGNLESPQMPQQRVIQNAPMQQFNNPYEMTPGNKADVRLEGLLGGMQPPMQPMQPISGQISDQERLRIMQPQPMQPMQRMQPMQPMGLLGRY